MLPENYIWDVRVTFVSFTAEALIGGLDDGGAL